MCVNDNLYFSQIIKSIVNDDSYFLVKVELFVNDENVCDADFRINWIFLSKKYPRAQNSSFRGHSMTLLPRVKYPAPEAHDGRSLFTFNPVSSHAPSHMLPTRLIEDWVPASGVDHPCPATPSKGLLAAPVRLPELLAAPEQFTHRCTSGFCQWGSTRPQFSRLNKRCALSLRMHRNKMHLLWDKKKKKKSLLQHIFSHLFSPIFTVVQIFASIFSSIYYRLKAEADHSWS